MSGFFHKPVGTHLTLRLDFRKAGMREGETLRSDLGWQVFPDLPGSPLLSACEAKTGDTLQCQVSGGNAGQTYFVTASALTNQHRSLKRCVVLRISNCKDIPK